MGMVINMSKTKTSAINNKQSNTYKKLYQHTFSETFKKSRFDNRLYRMKAAELVWAYFRKR